MAHEHVYIIDDSMVLGDIVKSIIGKLRRLRALGINIRILSPPCYLGIDISTHQELIAHNRSMEDILQNLQAGSLRYISMEDMKRVF